MEVISLDQLETEMIRLLKINKAESKRCDGADNYYWELRGEASAFRYALKQIRKKQAQYKTTTNTNYGGK